MGLGRYVLSLGLGVALTASALAKDTAEMEILRAAHDTGYAPSVIHQYLEGDETARGRLDKVVDCVEMTNPMADQYVNTHRRRGTNPIVIREWRDQRDVLSAFVGYCGLTYRRFLESVRGANTGHD